MGLDIAVYTNLVFLRERAVDESGIVGDGRPSEIDLYHVEGGDQLGSLRPGFYKYEVREYFRAGSYGNYNRWREQLCDMALGVEPRQVWREPALWEGRAFFELINFSDCEGFIGYEVSAKLAADFNAWEDRAKQYDEFNGTKALGFFESYILWKRGFEVASHNGVVVFQ